MRNGLQPVIRVLIGIFDFIPNGQAGNHLRHFSKLPNRIIGIRFREAVSIRCGRELIQAFPVSIGSRITVRICLSCHIIPIRRIGLL